MKIITQHQSVNPSDELLLCFDISKKTLNLFSRYARHGRAFRIEDEIPNATDDIEHVLRRCAGIADEAGLTALRVLAESTGGYERTLLQTAGRLGHKTALISPEHVAQLKKVESNDTGLGRPQGPARDAPGGLPRQGPAASPPAWIIGDPLKTYRRLRRLTSYYDDEECARSAVRQRIHVLIQELFPDYDKNAEFTHPSHWLRPDGCLQLRPLRNLPHRIHALRAQDKAPLEVHASRHAAPPL